MKDILLNNGDLIFVNGDINTGDSINQHIELLLISSRGDWRENPTMGCEIQKAIGGKVDAFLENEIKEQLKTAGLVGVNLSISDEEIKINY